MPQRTKDEFKEAFGDELRGLLVESFEKACRKRGDDNSALQAAIDGKLMFSQMIRGADLLDRIWKFLQPEPIKPPAAANVTAPPNGSSRMPVQADNGKNGTQKT